MIQPKDIQKLIDITKNTNIQQNINFSELMLTYSQIIGFCKSFMFYFCHSSSSYIYALCTRLQKLYTIWNELYGKPNGFKNNDSIKKQILQGFSNLPTKNNFVKIVSTLLIENDINKIKHILDTINDKTLDEIKNEALNISIQDIKSHCPEMDIDYIISQSDRIFDFEDQCYFFMDILNGQILKNKIPDTTKQELFEMYPELSSEIDKNGLINLSFENYKLLDRYNYDGLYYKNHFVYFDAHLKQRGENLLFVLLDVALQKNNKISVKIKLDFDKIISLKKYKHVIVPGGAFFGPPYDSKKFFIYKNEKPSLTIKIRDSQDFYDIIGNNISKTEFYFDPKNNSFLVEEIGKDEINGFYLNRMAHSEFDVNKKIVKHLDGSILYYDTSNYDLRESSNLLKRENLEIKKEKMFQIDGEFSIELWEKILLGYFQLNEMVLEYLDEEAYKSEYNYIINKKPSS